MQKEKIDYIQFIPCLDELQAKKRSTYALTPERFASFYRQLLHLWLQELSTGHYRSVKLFDDVFNLVVNRQVNACGLVGNCQIQYTIEADGSVYPCDFYVLDEYRLGFIQEQTLRDLFSQDVGQKFLCEKKEASVLCHTCPFQQMCHGGCKRMEAAMYVNAAGDFCGYQRFLQTFLPEVTNIQTYLQAL